MSECGLKVFELGYAASVIALALVLLLRSRVGTQPNISQRQQCYSSDAVSQVHFDFYHHQYNFERERSDRILEAFAWPVGILGALAGGLAYLWTYPLSDHGVTLLWLATVLWILSMVVLGNSYMPSVKYVLPDLTQLVQFELQTMDHFGSDADYARRYVEKELSLQLAEAAERSFQQNHHRLAGIKRAVVLIGASVLSAAGVVLIVAFERIKDWG